MGYTEKVVVIGAGISGLACAFRLKQFGLQPLVLEGSERAGGVIESVRRNGFLFEAGPQFPRFPRAVWQLVHDLNLESEFLAGDPKAKRYILKDGRLHAAPFSPGGLLTTSLVDAKSKFGILGEVFGQTSPPPQEESLAEFVERKFGTVVLDYLVDPIIGTIFFGDARKMGMESAFPVLVEWERNSGSLVRGALRGRNSKNRGAASDNEMTPRQTKSNAKGLRVTDALPSMGSFRSGMGALTERLAEELKDHIRYRQRIKCVAPISSESSAHGERWEIRMLDGERIPTYALVLALPAYATACLLEKSEPRLASLLNDIEYAPFCGVSSAYDRSGVQNKLDGFGFMVPRREGLETICTFWNSSMFGGRAPNGKVLMTSFAGREGSSAIFSSSEETCAQMVEAENAKILGITGRPVDRMVWRNPRALPQYNVGHARRVQQIEDVLRALPNLHIAGNFLTGRSIGDCVEIASKVAEKLHSQFESGDIEPYTEHLEGK